MQTRVSASQVKTYKQCPRKWAYEQLEGIRPPPGPAAELGTAVHAVLEVAGPIVPGVPPTKAKIERIAAPGFPYLLQGPREHKFTFEYGGILYNGIIDAHEILPGPEPTLLVQDWKTSSDPEKWGLNEESLPTDEQFLMYARAGLVEYPHIRRVRGRWVYLATRGTPRAKPVETPVLHAKDIVGAFVDRVHKVGLEIHKARKLPTIEHEQRFSECGAFGGCPHVQRCHGSASVTDRLKSLMSQSLRGGHIPAALTRGPSAPSEGESMSLLDLMEAEERQENTPESNPEFAPITPEEEPFVAANVAANPPEESPTEAGQAAQEAAYERAGQKLPPKKRGRPKGSKNKPKFEGVPASHVVSEMVPEPHSESLGRVGGGDSLSTKPVHLMTTEEYDAYCAAKNANTPDPDVREATLDAFGVTKEASPPEPEEPEIDIIVSTSDEPVTITPEGFRIVGGSYDVEQHLLILMLNNESPEELEQLSRAYSNVRLCR